MNREEVEFAKNLMMNYGGLDTMDIPIHSDGKIDYKLVCFFSEVEIDVEEILKILNSKSERDALIFNQFVDVLYYLLDNKHITKEEATLIRLQT